MHLKALEIQGFKSFPDKTVLTFGEAITAIVGPNGSGKSNLSDAIRWVMGEQSTRALRGGKMEDVIFGGTEKRRQVGFAEVSLILDNSDGALHIEEPEVMVTRRYYRSGESEYYINRRSVRLRDVNELFMDTGLGREGYSIIGQGKIDEILSVKSADRREVFEEAAGISRFRHRKEEAERKLERTEENLVRIGDKIDELELQVEPLRHQAEKAKKFLLLRDELRGLEISLWLEQLDKLRAAMVKASTDCEQTARQREEVRQKLEALYAASEEISTQMREKDLEAENIRFTVMQRQTDANEVESAVAVLKSNIQNNLDNTQRIRQELEQRGDRAQALSAQIGERKDRVEAIRAEQAAQRAALAQREEERKELDRQAGALAGELEELRKKEQLDTASAGEAKELLSALAAAAQELLDRDGAVRRALSDGEETLSALEGEAKEAETALREAKEERENLQNVIQGYTLRVQSREKKARAAEEEHMRLQVEEKSLQSRIHMLSEMEKLYEGYSKAVRLVMNEAERDRLRGLHGPVAGLIRVPDRCAVAIEIALGGAMQHIVTQREEDAKAAIGWLKRRDAGRCTFLPLDAIRPAQFRERSVEREPGFVGLGDTLVTCEEQYRNVLSYLLGRTVIAEDLDAAVAMARKYGHRFKIVTLDGQVLNPGGSMTGGSVSRSAGILSRANELERLQEQSAGLKVRLEEALRARSEAGREEVAARYELENAQEEQRRSQERIAQLEERVGQYRQRLEEMHRARDERREELEQLSQRSAQTEADTQKARARIEELEGSAAALRAQAQGKEEGQSRFRARGEALSQETAAIRARLDALDAELGSSQQALEQLEDLRRDLMGDREAQAALLAEYESKNRDLEGEIARKEGELETIRRENEARQGELQRLSEERLALEGKRGQADKDAREQNGVLLRLEREVSVLEQRRAALDGEQKSVLDRLWETYALSHEAAQAQRIPLESTAQAQRRVAELKKGISALGNINLDAIEEFERINERYTYLVDQRDDVEKAKKELTGVITDITGEMKRIFAQQFAILNEAFQKTFQELFGGGRAALELEDESDILNCGIEIQVQPPGKALKVLSLLSGGEKAFVAIALYFAILKVRPTPFCVMDEIEAALDDANVVRFAHYMRQVADKTQFIVITHRRGTMEEADILYGVTMQERGVSRMLAINLNDAAAELGIE